MKRLIPAVFAMGLAATTGQSASHPFIPTRIVSSIDSFVIVTRVTNGAWRPIGGLVQTVARDTGAIRIAVEYAFPESKQRVEMAMHPVTLAPIAHWEALSRRDRGTTNGEVMFSDGRARGAFILSRNVFDVRLDSGIVDNDASTALLAALPLESRRDYAFRSFASPGQVETTRVTFGGIDSVSVPAGRFESYRLTVMARDTSHVFVTTALPHRIVLVRLGNGAQEMRLVNRPLSP
jgi:hypothetical protein